MMVICNNVNIPNATALHGASLVAQTVKDPPAIQEDHVQSLGWEDPLEKIMGTHPVFLPGKNPCPRGIWGWGVGYSPWGCKESAMTEQLTLSLNYMV